MVIYILASVCLFDCVPLCIFVSQQHLLFRSGYVCWHCYSLWNVLPKWESWTPIPGHETRPWDLQKFIFISWESARHTYIICTGLCTCFLSYPCKQMPACCSHHPGWALGRLSRKGSIVYESVDLPLRDFFFLLKAESVYFLKFYSWL